MPTFCENFGIPLKQAEVDFVDIDLETDTKLYICPYAIQIRHDAWSEECGDLIRSFFSEVLAELRCGNVARVTHLLSHLHEPNETRLGQSSGRPSGRGVGRDKAELLGDALRSSRAFHTGLLTDIAEAELYIHGIGPDTISDLTTNIIRGKLAEYTLDQCNIHGVPTHNVRNIGPRWNPVSANWESTPFDLPVFRGRAILLVPKSTVRRRLSIDSQEFYNFHMVEYLQSEYLHAGGALVHTFKNGNQKVYKKSVKEHHPFIKNDLADFVQRHPEVLERYKQIAGAKGPLDNEEFDDEIRDEVFADVLIERLSQIPAGTENASQYHTLAMGICTFLFYPDLTTPIKEHEQHSGRKRVDIKFTNAATDGFFHRRMSAPQTRALAVFLECKNYSREVANPELDQLAGRFSVRWGTLGFLLCRTLENRERIIQSCRDTVHDGRGYMMPLEDADLIRLLTFVSEGRREAIDGYLEDLFSAISEP